MTSTSTHGTMGRLRIAAAVAAFTLGLGACQDGFFHDPAASMAVPLTLNYSYAAGTSAGSAAGPGEAFDKADRVVVVLTEGGTVIQERTVAVQPGSADKRVTLELQFDGTLEVEVAAELRLDTIPIFTGETALTLTPGQAATADVPLTPVTTGFAVTDVPAALRVGRSRQLVGTAYFGTGDALGPVTPTWEAVSSNITITPGGVVTPTEEGTAVVRATYNGRTDEASFPVVDPCSLPPGAISVGQTVQGTLSRDEDCLTDTGSNRLFDEYTLNLGGTTGFVATMTTGDGLQPFLPVQDGAGVQRHGPSSAESPMVREFILPAGAWEFRPMSRETGTSLDDAQEGSYSLTLNPFSGPWQDGCQATTNVYFGVSASGSITSSDCEDEFDDEPEVVRWWDGYNMRLLTGQNATVTATADFPFGLTHWVNGEYRGGVHGVPVGETGVLYGTVDEAGFHSFYVISDAHEGTGNYTISFTEGGATPAPNLILSGLEYPSQAQAGQGIPISFDLQNIGGDMPASASVAVDFYIAGQPSLNGPHAFLARHSFGGALENGGFWGDALSPTIPQGVSGPHHIVVVVDATNAVAESGESNTFSWGSVNVN